MALSNMGLLGMAGAMLKPGGGLGDGFTAYGQGLAQEEQTAMNRAYRQAVTQNVLAQQQEREAKIKASQQQQDALDQAFRMMLTGQQKQATPQSSPQGGLNGPLGSGTYGLDPLPAMAAKQAPATPQPAWGPALTMLLLRGGMKPEEVKLLAQSGDLGRQTVARIVEGQDAQGRPVQYREDQFGNRIGDGVPKPYTKEFRDTGGAVQPVDPYMGSFVGNGMPKTNSPDALLTDRRQRETNAIQRETNATNKSIAQSNIRRDDISSLRKEFAALPEAKTLKEVIPAQRSASEAIERDTAQADINLIYAAAKIFDPTSVVREGEYATVSSSAPPSERFQGLLNHLLGGGKLTASTRRALLAEINSRAQAAQASYDAARDAYSGIVERSGYNPKDVFADLPKLVPQKRPVDTFNATSPQSGSGQIRRPITDFEN